jgi:hypothetical protein
MVHLEPPACPIEAAAHRLLSRLLGGQVEPDRVLLYRRYAIERDIMMLTLRLRITFR